MVKICFAVIITFTNVALAVCQLDYDETPRRTTDLPDVRRKEANQLVTQTTALTEEYEPITLPDSKKVILRNIECDGFNTYAEQCALKSQEIFNYSAKVPPVPGKLVDWCSALRYLVSCGEDWNNECKDVSGSRFNQENIDGYKNVIKNICENTTFLAEFMVVTPCIRNVSDNWQFCFLAFTTAVDSLRNVSRDPHHYESHFFLCCERAKFRKCTLEALFELSGCTKSQAMAVQKFSVILSDGVVNQVCDDKIKYENCPGGDPRPSRQQLSVLVSNPGDINKFPERGYRRSGSAGNRRQFSADKSTKDNPQILLLIITQMCPKLLIPMLLFNTSCVISARKRVN